MRFAAAITGALLITALVVLFMQGLITARKQEQIPLTLHQAVDIYHQPQPEPEEPEAQTDPTAAPEPAMEPLQPGLPSVEPSVEIETPVLNLAVSELEIAAVGDDWSAPLGASGAELLEGQGMGAQGYVDVVPFSTRTPNVPELAWANKIDGWVLVAFNVTPEGTTRNVRVLDASPRGVFEEKVIAAVKDWRYTVNFTGSVKGDVVVTQKVEIAWRDYPMNVPHLD